MSKVQLFRAICAIATLSDASFIMKCRMILVALKQDTQFAPIVNEVNAADAKVNQMEVYQQRVLQGDRSVIAQRDQLQSEITFDMGNICDWVNNYAKGDLDIIKASGFSTAKERTPQTIPGNISKIGVKSTQAGVVQPNWGGSSGRAYYEFEATTNPTDETSWVVLGRPTKTRETYEGLQSGTRYYFRVRGVNGLGAGQYSDVAECMVA